MRMTGKLTQLLAATALAVSGPALAVELPKTSFLPLDNALQLAAAAIQECRQDRYQVSVAVVDIGGVTRAVLRDDQAGPHTLASATGKAFTAASLGAPTARYAKMIADKPELAGLRDMHPKMVILGGGLPLVVDGVRVGGIGVGGAPGGHLDEACAQGAIDRILGNNSSN